MVSGLAPPPASVIRFASEASLSCRRASSISLGPDAASRSAVALPMPLLAPVIAKTFSVP